MQWIVIGEGALGSLMAVKLDQAQEAVAIKKRQQQTQPIQIQFQDNQYRFDSVSWPIAQPATIIAAVKAYQVRDLLTEFYTHTWPQGTRFILSYNGMLDHEDTLLPVDTLFLVTTHGAYRDGLELHHAGQGESWLGWLNSEQPNNAAERGLANRLNNALPSVHWTSTIAMKRWQKLAINCLINPYTVIHQCTNGMLAELPIAKSQQAVAQEISAVAASFNVRLDPQQLLEQAQQVIQLTALNRSSMLSDSEHQRPTEIDFINGFIARQGAALGVAATANNELWQQVRELTQGYSGLR